MGRIRGRETDYAVDYLARLHDAKFRKRFSLREIAERVPQSYGTVRNVFCGASLSPSAIRDVCDILGIDYEREILRGGKS